LEKEFLGEGGRYPADDRRAAGKQFAHSDLPLRSTMSVVYSLYDALVSIKIPDDKAKAVIDAMEREMMDKVATKSDLSHVHELLSRDIQAVGKDIQAVSNNVQSVKESFRTQIKTELAVFENKMTARLAVIMAALIGAATALIGAVEHFH
jgi:hypothetical protein